MSELNYRHPAPERSEIDALPGWILLEFGVDWCPHCQRAAEPLATALADYPQVTHLRIEDGPGRRLGRSFRVKLWPCLILLRAGEEIARTVRPTSEADVRALLAANTGA